MSNMHRRFTYGTPTRDGFDSVCLPVLEKHRQLFNAYVLVHNHYLDSVTDRIGVGYPREGEDINTARKAWHAAARTHRDDPFILAARATLRASVTGLGSDVFWHNRRALWEQFFKLHLIATRDLIRLAPRPASVTSRIKGFFTFKFKHPVMPETLLVDSMPSEPPSRGGHVLICCPTGSKHAVVRIPIDQAAAGAPYTYHDFAFVMHRPLPQDCKVHSITVSAYPHGATWRLQVSFLLNLPVPAANFDVQAPLASIDVGWRMTPDGLLVATTLIGDKLSRLVLPLAIVADFAYLENIEAELSRTARAAAGPQLAFSGWRALLRTAHTPASTSELKLWAHTTRPMRHEALNLRARLARERLDLYRHYAAAVTSLSSAVAVEKLNLRKWSASTDQAPPPVHQSQKAMAAVSDLLRCLREACECTQRPFLLVPPQNTTRQHYACGHINSAATSASAAVHCAGCGQTYDPDENAARQIAKRAETQRSLLKQPSDSPYLLAVRGPAPLLSTESVGIEP